MLKVQHQVVELVRGLGVSVTTPVMLRSTNNLVMLLSPSPIVAKVSAHLDRATFELSVARELVAAGAPVLSPLQDTPLSPFVIDGRAVTLWPFIRQSGGSVIEASQIAAALAAFHEAAHRIDLRLMGQRAGDSLRGVLGDLERASFASRLESGDRAAVREGLAVGVDALSGHSSEGVVHGSPHRYNILLSAGEVIFIDFETVATGPIEWDLAHLEPDVAAAYPGPVDNTLLARLRRAISAMTAALCFEGHDRGPDMLDHARHHLDIVRSA